MLLKKFSYLLLAGCISTFAMSCDDEDDTIPDIVDENAPTYTLTSPTQAQLDAGFAAGDDITVTATVTDDRDLESVTLSLAAPGETTPGWLKTWEEADITDNTVNINETLTIPADAEAGTYVLTLLAHDDADNELTETWNITVAGATDENVVTFTITIPEAIEEDLYIAGEFANADGTAATWNEPGTNESLVMTKVDDTTYTITVPVMDSAETPGVIEYKFFRGTGWGGGEQTETCEGAANRTLNLPLESNEVSDITIAAWEGWCG